MKATVTKVKNPFESISRRSVLGVMGVGMTGVLVGCNDDLSPLKLTLKSDMGEITTSGSVMLTATVGAGMAQTIEIYETTSSGDVMIANLTAASLTQVTNAIPFTAANNGIHTYYGKITSVTGKDALSNPVVVKVNIAITQPPVAPTISLSSSSSSVTADGSVTLTAAVTGTTISKVEFYDSLSATPTVPVFTKTTAPYIYAPAFTSANNGKHDYTAKVTASDGGTATSAIAAVTVNIAATVGTRIALYTALTGTGSYVNFNHPTSGIKCILYRAATAQTGGVSNAGVYYVAYSRKCTHAGTIITNNPNTANPHVLTCQDHGATYNMDSNCAPINGVAPSALPTIAIKVGTDGIYV